MRRAVAGYIMIETAVALVVLSVGAFAIHRTIQEAIRTRGQAQDFTRARFLLDQVMNDLLMQPELAPGTQSGTFPDPLDSRFSWTCTVRRVNLPVPNAPMKPYPPEVGLPPPFEYPPEQSYLGHVRVTVVWERAGARFDESYETMVQPERLWQPPLIPGAPPR